MNGILLSGGKGTRLKPVTDYISKHLLPIGDKFVIDFPIQTLISMGCDNVTVVLGGTHFEQIVSYLQGGDKFGLNINYVFQKDPLGIAHAINLCKNQFKQDENFAVLLGDNIFNKPIMWKNSKSAQIALFETEKLNQFGVASLQNNKIISIQEKPQESNSEFTNLAITGAYLFTGQYFEYFEKIQPSKRGEYEITDILKQYLSDSNLEHIRYEGHWSDAGNHRSLAAINDFFYHHDD